jgi:hypothetical protein
MKPSRPLPTQHHFQRLALWTLALLQWIAATLSGNHAPSPRHRAQRGDIAIQSLKRRITALIIFRALHTIGPQRRIATWRHGRDLRRPHFMRSLLGAKLRRVLNHKDRAAHIAQLITILRNLDAYAARLAYRLRHLRRLWRIMPPIAPATALHGAPAPTPAFADSS